MSMQRILVIGGSGAGKSTLSVELAKKLNLPLVHLDRLFWRAGWQHVSREEFDNRLFKELMQPAWIIDGEYSRTLKTRLSYCDTVIFLDYSRFVCLTGVLKRILTGYGKTRPDMGEGCPERFDWEFLKYVWNFNKNNRQKTYHLLETEKNKNIIILKSRKEAARLLQTF